MNFTKIDSLFNFGMKVSIYSQKQAESQTNPLGWHKGGDRISYYANGIRKDVYYNGKSFYSLSFDYKFMHDDDVVYFAYSFPYTYQDVQHDLLEIESDPKRLKSGFCRQFLNFSFEEGSYRMPADSTFKFLRLN